MRNIYVNTTSVNGQRREEYYDDSENSLDNSRLRRVLSPKYFSYKPSDPKNMVTANSLLSLLLGYPPIGSVADTEGL